MFTPLFELLPNALISLSSKSKENSKTGRGAPLRANFSRPLLSDLIRRYSCLSLFVLITKNDPTSLPE